MSLLSFNGRVVIVTGAGRGIGRGYAKEFAKRGAMVVVNDLDKQGDGAAAKFAPADQVVEEISKAGGQAVASYDSVECGDKIIQKALSHFGRVDVIVNNAGILRDKSFKNMSETDWDLVHKVHLKGAFTVTKAVWPHFMKQNYGKLIFISSNSGIYGNFGQANYAAAKCGLIGFSNTLAVEGQKYAIASNVVVPTAISRMTTGLFPEELLESVQPEAIAPMAVYLCHESCKETGQIYEAAGGWFGKVEFIRSAGKFLPNATAENVRDSITKIGDMTNAKNFASMHDVTRVLLEMASKQAKKAEEEKAEVRRLEISSSKLESLPIFQKMEERLIENPLLTTFFKSVITYVLTDGQRELTRITLDLSQSPPILYEGDVTTGKKADAVVTVSDANFVRIASGELDSIKAYTAGELEVDGDALLLQKLQTLMEKSQKATLIEKSQKAKL